MPATVRLGSTGDTVRLLQSRLNLFVPTSLPPLKADGIFGPRTLARVQEFQRNEDLAVDGVAGPHTWDALDDLPDVRPRTGQLCANGQPGNAGNVQRATSQFLQFLSQTAPPAPASNSSVPAVQRVAFIGAPTAGGVRSAFAGGLGSFTSAFSSTFARITAAQVATATPRYGSSIDFTRVFLSTLLGVGSRPFTVAVPVPTIIALSTGLAGTIQVMNCGTLSPSNDTLLHELAHVWQSQHDSDATRFMTNSVKCQAAAIAFNEATALIDPTVKTTGGGDFPVHFPASAYAFKPKQPFSSYSCEQMANALDHSDAAVSAHVKGAATGTVDADSIVGLSSATIEDRRTPGVVF